MSLLDRNGIFLRRLLGSIGRMPSFTPVGLAVVQNAPLWEAWAELDELEDEGLVRHTGKQLYVDSDELFSTDPTLSDDVVRLKPAGPPVLDAPQYEKTAEWVGFYAEWCARNGG